MKSYEFAYLGAEGCDMSNMGPGDRLNSGRDKNSRAGMKHNVFDMLCALYFQTNFALSAVLLMH